MAGKIELANENICTGCSVCSDICPFGCITMAKNNEGFLYPKINYSECIACKKCMKVCPALNTLPENDIKQLYVARMKDEKKLHKSTSGGLFQVIAEKIIEKNGVVFGATFDETFLLFHKECRYVKDLDGFMGSKYLQSNTEGIYKLVYEISKRDKDVFFTGTPCQCDALKHYFLVRNGCVPDNVVLCELMCHGVSSPGVFEKYISYLNKKYKGEICNYNFRYKKPSGFKSGWENMNIRIDYIKGKNIKTDIHRSKYDAWHFWFGEHFSVRKSCFNCKYRTLERVSDLTIGDFWKIKKVIPDLDITNGISAVFVNTIKGKDILEECSNQLLYKEIELDKIHDLFKVPICKDSVMCPSQREQFFKIYNEGGIKELIKKFSPDNYITAIIKKIKWMVKR